MKFAAAGAPAEGANEALDLPVLGRAPEFVGNEHWFNTPGDRPLTLRGLRGRVVLVDFWTCTCINCIRTFIPRPEIRPTCRNCLMGTLTLLYI